MKLLIGAVIIVGVILVFLFGISHLSMKWQKYWDEQNNKKNI